MGGVAPCSLQRHNCVVWHLEGNCSKYEKDDARCVANVELELVDSGWRREPLVSHPPLRCSRLNFEAMDAVGPGWQVSAEKAPEGFLLYGGSACVIERKDECIEEGKLTSRSLGERKRVLLALPRWAVDLQRARWLASGVNPSRTQALCRLWRVVCTDAFDHVVFEFEYPAGIPFKTWQLEHGLLPELAAKAFCHDVLQAVTRLQPTPLRLWGLLDATAAHLDAEGALCGLLPIGCLLSAAGAHAAAAAAAAARRPLAPELPVPATASPLEDEASAADGFAAAALALEALAGVGPKEARELEVLRTLPHGAADLLLRMLHEEPAWRLSCEDALLHPWLAALQTRWAQAGSLGGS